MGWQHSAYPCRALLTTFNDNKSHRLMETLPFQCFLKPQPCNLRIIQHSRITAHPTLLRPLSPFSLQRNRRAVNISTQGGIQLLYRNASPA